MPTSMFQTYITGMKCALDLLTQYDTLERMSTGSAEIDSLIDGIQESSFYLFYGSSDNHLILDSLLYRQLTGCILPKNNNKNGFESVAIFLNNVDISVDKNKHQLLNPEKIAITAKYAGIEPKIVSKNLFVQTALLSVFGFNRSLIGLDKKKNLHWWDEIYHQRERDIESAKTEL